MAEYIERDAAKKAACEGCNAEFGEDPCEPCDCSLMVAIDAIPTADFRPVVRGKWIVRYNPGTGWYRVNCSECGEDVTSEVPVIGFFPNAKPTWDFCPYCGADMREES